MNTAEAKNIVINALDSKYNDKSFEVLVSNVFKNLDFSEKINQASEAPELHKSLIESYRQIGVFTDSENNRIAVLEVHLNRNNSIERARSAQRNFIAHYLKNNNLVAALVSFVTPDLSDWRLSLVKLEYVAEIVNEKLKSKEDITPAKRSSFLVGENEGCHTAISRLLPLVESNYEPNLNELELAFGIEQVTEEFYSNYRDLFLRMKDELEAMILKDSKLRSDFESKKLKTSDFAKKTMGQLAFIYFLQKKGWLGVEAGKEWGLGPKNFLRDIFNNRENYGTNFFNDVLEPLFYKALAQDRGRDSIYTDLDNCRIPFLNGGLFEPMNGYSWENTNILFEDSLFSNNRRTQEGDVGDGILDIFDRYNFTVYENEPLDKEVAVDPEMLGKVFENLLDVQDRKDKGAFYTPREIVHFLCQEALINYLHKKISISVDIEKIRIFIVAGITESINEHVYELDDLLKNVRICDPAVGSGAFPLGMLNEIVKARGNLDVFFESKRTKYQLKFDAISNSLYGVDLDPGAIEIAKLRMWLSLAVDEGRPSPLPNLDNKLMQGNSLISKYKGIEIFGDKFFHDIKTTLNQESHLKDAVNKLQSEFAELHNTNKLDDIKRNELETKLLLNRKRLQDSKKPTEKKSLELFEDNRSIDAKNKIILLEQKVKNYLVETSKTKKEDLKHEIDNLKWDLIELSLVRSGNQRNLEEVRALREKKEKPFFIWQLEFNEVFNEQNGFDIVIGNPPYRQIQKFSGSLYQNQLELEEFESFIKTGDLYCLFYERGLSLLKDGGILSFITSNKWMRAAYGEKTRAMFSRYNPLLLVDLGPGIFESATVDTNLLVISKSEPSENTMALNLTNDFNLNENINYLIHKHSRPLSGLSRDIWLINSGIDKNLKLKVENKGTPLSQWDIYINYGIKTGLNDAFIINEDTKKRLFKDDISASKIIKPVLRGRCIKQYSASWENEWLLFIPWHFPLNKNPSTDNILNISEKAFELEHPAIFNYLSKFKPDLLKRNKEEVGIRYEWFALQRCAASYLNEFNKEKIVYQEIVRSPQFYLDVEAKFFCEASTFLITGSNLKYLIGLLNSKPVAYFFKHFYAGGGLGSSGFRYKKKFIENLPLPIFNENLEFAKQIENKVIDILELKKLNKDAIITDISSEIDSLIYKFYGLNEEEISLIEKSIKQ